MSSGDNHTSQSASWKEQVVIGIKQDDAGQAELPQVTVGQLIEAGLWDTNHDVLIDGIAASMELGERVLKAMGTENLGLHAEWIRDEEDDLDHQKYRAQIIAIRANEEDN